MATLELIVLIAPLLVVLHVTVAAYLYRVVLSGDAPAPFLDPEAGQWVPEATDGVDGSDGSETPDDSVSCPTCETANDPSYRFCRQCVGDLTGRRRVNGGAAADRLGS
jgi:hypothetical protein